MKFFLLLLLCVSCALSMEHPERYELDAFCRAQCALNVDGTFNDCEPFAMEVASFLPRMPLLNDKDVEKMCATHVRVSAWPRFPFSDLVQLLACVPWPIIGITHIMLDFVYFICRAPLSALFVLFSVCVYFVLASGVIVFVRDLQAFWSRMHRFTPQELLWGTFKQLALIAAFAAVGIGFLVLSMAVACNS